MWFKQGISLEDSNFDMENYFSLVDVKLLLKKILDSNWNKLLWKLLESKVQLAPPTKNVTTPKSVIKLTAFIAFETGRKPSSACCNYVHFSHRPLISVAQREVFPILLSSNSHTMDRFIIFMLINQDDDGIDYKCYVKNLLRFF